MTSVINRDHGESGENLSNTIPPAPRWKRASRACMNCRTRKVRCDVVQNGTPCTNCRADTQTCIVPRRSRKHRALSDSSRQMMQLGGQSSPYPVSTTVRDRDARMSASHTNGGRLSGEMSITASFEDLSRQSSTLDGRGHLFNQDRSVEPPAVALDVTGTADTPSEVDSSRASNPQLSNFGIENISSAEATTPSHMLRPNARQYQLKDHVDITCYQFLETDFISNISLEDFEYLDHLDCLQLPQRDILDELVRAYFLYIHPLLPLIDEEWFWMIYQGRQSDAHNISRISVFVFQAMLLVACSYVPPSTIQNLGFRSIRIARATYYRRAKALYDFEIERSNLAKAQGALLMTYHVPLNEPQINTYWLGIATHFARAEGADRYVTYATRDPARYNQLKRLWWCCIIRDRTLALGLRRSILIHSTKFEELWPQLTNDDLMNEVEQSLVHCPSVKMDLLRTLLALCNLCVLMTNILQLLYPADGVHADGDRLDVLKRIYTYTSTLNRWYDAMTSDVESRRQHGKSHNAVTMFTNISLIYCQSAKIALCNHRIMLTVHEPADYSFERLQTKNELQNALREIAYSLRAIRDAEMIEYTPISLVAFLALPSVCYNLDLDSRAPTQAAINQARDSNIYRDFLRVLQLRYEGTDRALDNMSKLMSSINLKDAVSPATTSSGLEDFPARDESVAIAPPPERWQPIRHGDGIDIIISEPQKYIQISYVLDFFLSRGRFPTKSDMPPNILSSSDGNRGWGGSGSWDDPPVTASAASGTATTKPQLLSRASESNIPSQDPTGTFAQAPLSSGSHRLAASSEGGLGTNPDHSVMFSNDATGQGDMNSNDITLEDFMIDGPFAGVEQLHHMIYRYHAQP